ncbi:MAG: DUF1579 family protein [Myxococcales bacterium]
MAKRILLGVLAAAALGLSLQAAKAQTAGSATGQQNMPGAMGGQKNLQTVMSQAQAIAPVFSNPVAWRGEVPSGAMGQNAPQASSQGVANCGPLVQGWYSCDVTNRYMSTQTGQGGTGASDQSGQGGTGQMGQTGSMSNMPMMSWAGHMVVGYDANANAYKAIMVDNQGTGLMTYDGTLNGKKLTLTGTAPMMMMGQSQKQRLSFDYTDPNNIQFLDERQPSGQQTWTTFEKATIKPFAGTMNRQASTPSRR